MKSWSKNIILVIASMMAVFALLFASGCSGNNRDREYRFAEDAQSGEYVRPTRALGQSGVQKEPSYFTIQVNADPRVLRGGKRCNLMIGNPAENEQYVKVKLILDDTGDELFCSEMLKPGERNAYVELEQIPSAGEHAATAVFMVYDPESMEQITEIDAGVVLTVE